MLNDVESIELKEHLAPYYRKDKSDAVWCVSQFSCMQHFSGPIGFLASEIFMIQHNSAGDQRR